MTDTARKPEIPALGFTQEDWEEVSDNPELTDEQLAQLRPASEMPPEVYALLPKRGRGRPKTDNPKVNITLRLDPALVEAYKATGPGWQTRIHKILETAMPAAPLDEAEIIDRQAKRDAKLRATGIVKVAYKLVKRNSSTGRLLMRKRDEPVPVSRPTKNTA